MLDYIILILSLVFGLIMLGFYAVVYIEVKRDERKRGS